MVIIVVDVVTVVAFVVDDAVIVLLVVLLLVLLVRDLLSPSTYITIDILVLSLLRKDPPQCILFCFC